MGQIEIVAALLGVANVLLIVRRSVWNYPFGIATVTLYFFVFASARLYSDALLQIFFLVIQVYGWRNWSVSGRIDGGVRVGTLTSAQRWVWLGAALAGSLTWGFGMAAWTDAAAPFADAAVAGFSVAAQWLMALRRIESWVLWIGVDVLAIGLFIDRGLIVTAALYALFLALAVVGFVAWARVLRRTQQPAA